MATKCGHICNTKLIQRVVVFLEDSLLETSWDIEMVFRSRKLHPDSKNVPAGSTLATVLSNPLHFIDEDTESQEDEKTLAQSPSVSWGPS